MGKKKKRKVNIVEVAGTREIQVEGVSYYYPSNHPDKKKRGKRTKFDKRKKLVAKVRFSTLYRDEEGKLKKKRYEGRTNYVFKPRQRKKPITRKQINKLVVRRLEKRRKPVVMKIIDDVLTIIGY